MEEIPDSMPFLCMKRCGPTKEMYKLGIVRRKGKGGDCEAGIYFSWRDTDRIKSGTTWRVRRAATGFWRWIDQKYWIIWDQGVYCLQNIGTDSLPLSRRESLIPKSIKVTPWKNQKGVNIRQKPPGDSLSGERRESFHGKNMEATPFYNEAESRCSPNIKNWLLWNFLRESAPPKNK